MALTRIALLVCAGLLLFAAPPGAAAKRIAFVAGIDRYDNLLDDQQLEKAVNDARSVGGALERLGFTVMSHENAGRLDLVRAWSRFLAEVEPGDTTAVFFAGHGIELSGVNYLVPRDVPIVGGGEEEVLKAASIRVSELIEGLKDRSPQVSLVILDACRDNPFVTAGGRSLGTTRGLARIDPARGTFVMFSADAGQRALDRMPGNDPDPNSVYTRSLLPLLTTPGLGLRDIAVRVRNKVNELARSAGHDQFPAYYDALVSELYLAGTAPTASPGELTKRAAAPPGPARVPRDPAPDFAKESALWYAIDDSTNRADFEAYLGAYPDGAFAPLARARLALLAPGPTPPPAPPRQSGCDGLLVRVAARQDCLKPGDSFRDLDSGPEMVVVPAGTFTMGSPASEAGRDVNESPQHDVTISRPFAVGKHEVTRGEFATFVVATGHVGGTSCWSWTGKDWGDVQGKTWFDPGYPEPAIPGPDRVLIQQALNGKGFSVGTTDGAFGQQSRSGIRQWQESMALPETGELTDDQAAILLGRRSFDAISRQAVSCVSWHDAQAYARWLSEHTGQQYRLPTEAEWEYANRAQTRPGIYPPFAFGYDPNDGCAYANVADRTARDTFSGWTVSECADGYLTTSPVGLYRPNAFGLHDTHGNVWEWVLDCYQESYAGAPADGSEWQVADCQQRGLRGGSWDAKPTGTRSALRNSNNPGSRNAYNGFRLVRAL